MSVHDFIRLTALLLRLIRKKAPSIGDFRCNIPGPLEIVYDLYFPKTRTRNTILLLHGCTVNGKDDPRLQHLARCMAATGSCCIVPTLPGLSRLQWAPTDIDGLAALILQLTTGRRSVGMVGFSFGGSYAMCAAAQPRAAARVRFVLSFGAYHSLDELYRYQAAFGKTAPPHEKALDSWIYLQLVAAKRQAAGLGLSDEVSRRLDDLLKRYCHTSTAEEKKAFYRQHFHNEAPWELESKLLDAPLLDRLSPRGKLKGLECPVFLFHDASDSLVPADHAGRIAGELAEEGKAHRILVTNLLNHVNLSSVFNLVQWYRFAAYLNPLVRAFPKDS